MNAFLLYLFCLIWKRFDLEFGAWLICTELGYFKGLCVGALQNVSAAAVWSRNFCLHRWLIWFIKCPLKIKSNTKTYHFCLAFAFAGRSANLSVVSV